MGPCLCGDSYCPKCGAWRAEDSGEEPPCLPEDDGCPECTGGSGELCDDCEEWLLGEWDYWKEVAKYQGQ